MIPEILRRLRDEHMQLHERTRALSRFLTTAKYQELDDVQKQLLSAQHGHMVNYRYVLEQRMAHLSAQQELSLVTADLPPEQSHIHDEEPGEVITVGNFDHVRDGDPAFNG